MKVIFLDIDGVLNNTSWLLDQNNFDNFCPDNVKIFNHIIKKTNAKVVISSTWRLNHPDLKKIFEDQGVECDIIGYTPDLSECKNGIYRGSERGTEIFAWILKNWQNENIEKFIILDDENDMGKLKEFLIQTNMENGITGGNALQIINYLNDYKLSDFI